MTVRVDALEAQQLIADGVRTIDVLPAGVYRQEHLPDAINLPLETFDPVQVDDFDRSAPVLVYCFDQHCDLSARASRRLDSLGFEQVHDLIGGRAAWTALGLPTEGAVGDRRRISEYVRRVPTLASTATIADLDELGPQRFPVPVTSEDNVLLGAVNPSAVGLPDGTAVAAAMIPAPGTIRPEMRVDEVIRQLRRDSLDHVFVTAVNGVLLGLIITEELHV